MQRKITLAYGIAFLAAVFGSILGFALSKQDEKVAFSRQEASMAQLVLINSVKGSVIELLVHQDELINEISDKSSRATDIQSDFAHFVADYQEFKQHWTQLSSISNSYRAAEELHMPPQAAYATTQIARLKAHEASVGDYIRQVDGLTQDINVLEIQANRLPALHKQLTKLNQSLFISDLESFLDSIALIETDLQGDHAEATALLRRAIALQIQITIASILVSSGLGILLMNRFSHILLDPLQHITQLTQRSIQTGVFNLKLPVHSQDEIGLLAQTLNLYVQKMMASQAELQREEEILQRQSATLAQLSQSSAIAQGDLTAAFQELTAATAQLLQVERVGIWLFNDEQAIIRCATLFHDSDQLYSEGYELIVADYPSYFTAIVSTPAIAIDDVRTDPRTGELIDSYLDPLQISSMLDARFDVDGACKGIICGEHIGEQRTWSQAEQNVIRSVANLVALTIEANQRHQKAEQLEQALLDLKQSQFQMIHSEKMATLGQLISGIAHEINNPVSFIYGNLPHANQYIAELMALIEQYQTHYPDPPAAIATTLETIELDFLQEDLNKLLQSMQVGSERIHTIIRSMSNFSRMDESEIEDVDIHAGIDNSLLLLNTRLRAQHWRPAIHVVKDYGSLPPVTCRAGQINQVLMNLLSNAIDALDDRDRPRCSEPGRETASEAVAQQPRTIEIRTRSQPQLATPSIVISVTDNGAGMSQATCDRLFDAFFTTKPAGKGTGLGLSISHQIVVKNHGGQLSCSSKPGEGTTFTVTLPCQSQAAVSRPASSERIAC